MEDLLHYSLNNNEMSFLNPTASFVPYDMIHKYNDIDQLLGKGNMAFILYLIKNERYGHWTCIYKIRGYNGINDECLVYFNSYGFHPDYDLKFVPKTLKEKVFEHEPFLFQLIKQSPYTCYYNTHCLQSDGVATCGAWVSHRLMNKHLTNDEYARLMKSLAKDMKITPDEAVAIIIHEMLQN